MSTPLPPQVRLLTSVRDVPARAWDALVPPDGGPFLEWGYPPPTRGFFESALRHLRHRVEVVEARRDGALVAGAFNLANERALFGSSRGALEPIPFLHFHACLYHPVEECIALGRERFEPRRRRRPQAGERI